MQIELDKLGHVELNALIAQAEKQKTKLHRQQRDTVRKKLIKLAKAEGYTIEELFGTKAGKSTAKVAAKYRNPAKPDQTWSGRGKRPLWFVAALNQGKNPSDLAI